MLLDLGLFLLFLYFKIAHVHKKEEKVGVFVWVQHGVVALTALALFGFGFLHTAWYGVLGLSFLFFIIASMIITAVQVGIFIDGKPAFGLSHIYKITPLITVTLLFITLYLWNT